MATHQPETKPNSASRVLNTTLEDKACTAASPLNMTKLDATKLNMTKLDLTKLNMIKLDALQLDLADYQKLLRAKMHKNLR